MGARYDSQFVRHSGDHESSLVDEPKTGFADGHPGQSIRIPDVRCHRIGRHICGYQYHYACALHIECPCLVGWTRRHFSTGCMSPVVYSFFRALSRFISFRQALTPLLIVVQVGLTGRYRISQGDLSNKVSTALEKITFRVGIPRDQESWKDLSISRSSSPAHDAGV